MYQKASIVDVVFQHYLLRVMYIMYTISEAMAAGAL